MPLYIKDDEVDALASELKDLMNAPTKVEAVRGALRRGVEEARDRLPMRRRLARTLALAAELGPFPVRDPAVDPDGAQAHKRFTDELWGEA